MRVEGEDPTQARNGAGQRVIRMLNGNGC